MNLGIDLVLMCLLLSFFVTVMNSAEYWRELQFFIQKNERLRLYGVADASYPCKRKW